MKHHQTVDQCDAQSSGSCTSLRAAVRVSVHPVSVHRVGSRVHRAFTLLELILVLAILVALGAVVAPIVGDAFHRQKLQASADMLRSEWEHARLTAMKTGQIQVFKCTIGASDYSIDPYMAGDDMLNASSGAVITTSVGTVAQTNSDGSLSSPAPTTPVDPLTGAPEGKKLDEEVTFVNCVVNGDMRAMSIVQSQGGLAATSTMNQMVMFYPDGSTSTAEVTIQNAAGLQRAVRMRGLTGTTQVLTPGEIPTVVTTPAVGGTGGTTPTQ